MDFIFNPINKWLDGKKTLIGNIGVTIAALGVIVNAFADGLVQSDLTVISGAFGTIMFAWGISHKVEKSGPTK